MNYSIKQKETLLKNISTGEGFVTADRPIAFIKIGPTTVVNPDTCKQTNYNCVALLDGTLNYINEEMEVYRISNIIIETK